MYYQQVRPFSRTLLCTPKLTIKNILKYKTMWYCALFYWLWCHDFTWAIKPVKSAGETAYVLRSKFMAFFRALTATGNTVNWILSWVTQSQCKGSNNNQIIICVLLENCIFLCLCNGIRQSEEIKAMVYFLSCWVKALLVSDCFLRG